MRGVDFIAQFRRYPYRWYVLVFVLAGFFLRVTFDFYPKIPADLFGADFHILRVYPGGVIHYPETMDTHYSTDRFFPRPIGVDPPHETVVQVDVVGGATDFKQYVVPAGGDLKISTHKVYLSDVGSITTMEEVIKG
jgi:hypothetical protein